MLGIILFRIAKAPFAGKIIGNAFRFCGSAIPVKKVLINRDVIAFVHPKPCYQNHIILSPRKAISDLHQLAADAEGFYFSKILQAAKQIARTNPEYVEGFTLVANGGKKQEVSQVHFHMYTDRGDPFCDEDRKEIYRDETICVSEASGFGEQKHYTLSSILPDAPCANENSAYPDRLIQCVAALTGDMDRKNQSCSLVFGYDGKAADKRPVFHFFRA